MQSELESIIGLNFYNIEYIKMEKKNKNIIERKQEVFSQQS